MKNYKLVISLLTLTLLLGGCKVKESAGAYRPAEDTKKGQSTADLKSKANTQTATESVAEMPDKIRSESFKVVDGEDATALKTYNVVIGSFQNRANAQGLQSLMKGDYAPIIVINEQGMFRVILISYDDYVTAKQKIAQIKSQFDDAWVLVQKK